MLLFINRTSNRTNASFNFNIYLKKVVVWHTYIIPRKQ